jgi:hypothetical protein
MPSTVRSLAVALAVGAAVAALTSGCGGSGSKAAVSVKVTVQSYFFGKEHSPKRETRSYLLSCDPVGGTLPYAARICRDIARHPQPLLDPLPARYGCSGGPDMAVVTVSAKASGRATAFSGNPDCTWPGGVGLAVYFDAAGHEARYLAPTEKRLRCDDDPALLVTPRPEVSVFACTHNLWTPRTAELIRIAKRSAAIKSLGSHLFPNQIGNPQCTIHGGGPAPGVVFHGVCEVTVKKVWSTPTVTFVESWRDGGKRWRSGVRLVIGNGHVTSTQRIGVDPPQLWS